MRTTIFFIVALLFLYGCGGGGSDDIDLSYNSIHKGSEGVALDFIDGAPLKEIQVSGDGTRFKVGVEMENKGAYDVDEGYLTISVGSFMDDNYEKPYRFSLEGKTILNPKGDKTMKLFDAGVRGMQEKQIGEYNSNVLSHLCYGYKTEAKAEVCIDTKMPGAERVGGHCKQKTLTMSNQGAPVAVKRIESANIYEGDNSITAIRPQYKIYIDNVGNGVPIRKDYVRSVCGPAFGIDDQDVWNVVEVSAELPGNELVCVPEKYKIGSGLDYVVCSTTKEIPVATASYTSPLMVYLDYGYYVRSFIPISIHKTG
ncbi:MAG: hypothetical protein GY861_00625 [bacterium]|nr:hypothetical protein [bacterium]